MTFELVGCEEYYNENIGGGLNMGPLEQVTLLTEGMVLTGSYSGGQLLGASGKIAKVEQIEMDTVKITSNGKVEYLELGPNVRWMEEEDRHVN